MGKENEMRDEHEIHEREEREHLDRAFASNDKVQFDNVISHNGMAARYAEIALGNAVAFQSQMNMEYLASTKQEREHNDIREKQVMEHADERRTHVLENNRFTLDRLYGIYPEEAAGMVPVLEVISKIIKEEVEAATKWTFKI